MTNVNLLAKATDREDLHILSKELPLLQARRIKSHAHRCMHPEVYYTTGAAAEVLEERRLHVYSSFRVFAELPL